MASAPIFVVTPILGIAQIATANTARDGTGTLGTLVTGGANGTRISKIVIQSTASSVVAGLVRIFITIGAVTALYSEVVIAATSPSNTVDGYRVVLEYYGEKAIVLPTDAVLKASTSIAQTFNVFAEGGDF